jgi:hypothetical protein
MKSNYKKIYTLLFSCTSILYFAQNLGINTTSPQQKLEISGTVNVANPNIGVTGIQLVQPTIRIDGLNSTNNPNVFSAANIVNPLYVDANGNTFTIKGLETYNNTPPGTDVITTPYTLTANPSGITPDLISVSFTLKQASIVNISSMLSVNIKNSSGAELADGIVRLIGAGIYFTAKPASETTITLNSTTANESIPYTNFNTGSISSQLKFGPSLEMSLPAGNYTVALRGIVSGFAAKAGFSANPTINVSFGGDTDDRMNVFVRPL